MASLGLIELPTDGPEMALSLALFFVEGLKF